MALPADADIPLILGRIRPGVSYGWKGNGSTWSNPGDIEWYDQVSPLPTVTELENEWSAIVAEETTKDSVRQQLKTAYAPLAGRLLTSLTNTEQRLLLEILVYIMGGIDEETRLLRPANQWRVAKELLKA